MATNPTLLTQPIAANGAKNVIPNTTSTAGAMSQDQGFPAETALPLGAGGVAPSREDFNGAFNLLSGILFMAQKGFVFNFDNMQDYYVGCVVVDPADGEKYECIVDAPAGTGEPHETPANWKLSAIDISGKANITLNNLDTANLACHVVVDSYYDDTTGDWWREYDDGWIEQGGKVPTTAVAGTQEVTTTVTLLKAMSDDKYISFADGNGTIFASTSTPTTTTVNVTYRNLNAGHTFNISKSWYVCGMGASV